MAAADTARLIASLELDSSKFTRGVGKAMGGLGKLDKQMSGLRRNTGRIGGGLAKATAVFAGAAVAGLAGSAKAAIDFQDAFQGVVKTVDAADLKSAGLTFEDLSNSIRKMSREMPISAIELAGIAEAAGAMGIKAKDIESFTKQVAILASTTNVSADDAATALGQLSTQIGLTGAEFDNFAAALVDLGNKGNSTESQILDIEKRAGGFASSAGLAKDAALGWAAAAANIFGDRTEMGGTALGKFFNVALVNMQKLGKVAGMDSKAFKKLFEKDASGALQKFIRGLSKLKGAERLKAIQDIFGKGTGVGKLLNDLANGVDKNLNPALRDSVDAWKKATAAQEEFNKRNATVRSAITRLKNNVIDAAVTIGEGMAPAIGRAADKLATLLSDEGFRGQLKSIGEDVGKAIDSIDWDSVIDAAKSVAKAFQPALSILQKIAETIARLPPEVIAGGATALIVDRASGGAITAGIGGIIGGLGESLAKSLAARIPLFGSAFVQPVFVTNMGAGLPGTPGGVPGGKPTSGLGKVVDIGSKVLVVGFVAELAEQIRPVLQGVAADLHNQFLKGVDNWLPPIRVDQLQWPLGPKNTPTILPDIFGGNGLLGGTPEGPGRIKGKFDPSGVGGGKLDPKAEHYLQLVSQKQGEAKAAFEGGLKAVDGSTKQAGQDVVSAARSGFAGATAATNVGSSRIVGAIQANRPIVTTSVEVNVTSSGVQKATTTSTRYGEQNGSAGGGGGHGGASNTHGQ